MESGSHHACKTAAADGETERTNASASPSGESATHAQLVAHGSALVWVVTSGDWGWIDSIWTDEDAAWKRAEEVGKGTGYIAYPTSYPLKSPNAPAQPRRGGGAA